MDPGRRFFLRGGVKPPPTPVSVPRPPWALPEAAFVQACTRCDACVAACPLGRADVLLDARQRVRNALVAVDAGLPFVEGHLVLVAERGSARRSPCR
jgi:ferredoxin